MTNTKTIHATRTSPTESDPIYWDTREVETIEKTLDRDYRREECGDLVKWWDGNSLMATGQVLFVDPDLVRYHPTVDRSNCAYVVAVTVWQSID